MDEQRLIKINKNFYENYADSFNKSRKNIWSEFDEVLKYVKRTDYVLDIGCGNGRFSKLFDKDQYLGIDFSEALLKKAEAHNPLYKYMNIDITKKDWKDKINRKFDVVILIAVLHHIPSSKLRIQVLSDMQTILNKNAIIVMSLWHFQKNNSKFRNIGNDNYLVSWNKETQRYVCYIKESEIEEYVKILKLKILHKFIARDNSYYIFKVL
jgi:tRNA (uracil-5-)-methyltransferase TRM9